MGCLTEGAKRPGMVRPILSCIACIAAAFLLCVAVNRSSSIAKEEQLSRVESNVMHSIMQCYAMEGRYPLGMEELSSGYGFVEPEGYFVDYQYMGPNILPVVTVLEEGGGA